MKGSPAGVQMLPDLSIAMQTSNASCLHVGEAVGGEAVGKGVGAVVGGAPCTVSVGDGVGDEVGDGVGDSVGGLSLGSVGDGVVGLLPNT